MAKERNTARDGYTVGDLIRNLSVYDPALPVRFRSCECGGYWPHKGGPSEGSRKAMGVFVDEQIQAVSDINPNPADLKLDHLQISLMEFDCG